MAQNNNTRARDAAADALKATADTEGRSLAAAASVTPEDLARKDPPKAPTAAPGSLEEQARRADSMLVDRDTRDGDVRQANTDAVDRLRAMQAELARQTDEEVRADLEKWQYFVRCRRGCIGVFLNTNPNGRELGNADWFATYRGQNEIWREPVYCQVCFRAHPETLDMQGEAFPLQLLYTGELRVRGRATPKFVVPQRWVFRYPKDLELARRMPRGGVERGARVSWESGNADWRPTPEQIERQGMASSDARKLVGGAA